MRPSMRRSVRMIAAIGVLALVLAACGGDDDDDDAASNGPTTTVAESTPDTTTAPTTAPDEGGGAIDQAATVAIAQTQVGESLVDESGYTLYVFENDSPLLSACQEGCADAWPPVLVTGEIVVGDGLDAANFTT